ncbi:3-hydroxyacyl-CoA dehydrogenase family protein [Fulvivirga lutea]|uniref:3-hydroxyacyl-CoA dehydrogenase n=1 Tax=Fulvivirga lutea TaxID=2810512 RepID=A0A975A1U9_9BACT|nr:3-hydroxyacyl-CoA dehydrogenase family protein [Fulvivirga lutea]QSE98605.1 3-hydroxyacyl-CoA dehydrogenase [Fulvivirga lutea]
MINVLAVGNDRCIKELEDKLGDSVQLRTTYELSEVTDLSKFDVIFDFEIADNPENYLEYKELKGTIVLLNTVKITLSELAFTFGNGSADLYGFNGLPSFINREVLEVSALTEEVSENFNKLNWDYQLVDDRVGLVTPRIVLMIINEAFYTVQEGTATKEDIDLGMKLGTNYPYGPFEWLNLIGIEEVYETLEAIYEDTKEERYKIAPFLKKEYLKS